MSSFEDIIEEVRKKTLYSKEDLIVKFGWEEYFIFALMLSISAAIGIFFWWKGQHNNAQFLLGGRNMGTFPMTMSLIAR
jgi:sodium-coupled monocarboxylate transporter 8/12